jgi:uncharacterized protein DUF6612
MTNKKPVIVFVALALVLLVSACGSPASSTGSQTPLQVLQKSLAAMQQLKAVHINMKLTSNGDWGRSSTSSTAHTFSVNATASGDEVRPDKSMLHLNVAQGYNVAEITLGNLLYVQNTKGQWYVLDKSKDKGSANNPFTSLNSSTYDKLLAIAEKATYTDHGVQTLNGESLRHITVTFSKDVLKDLLNATNLPTSQQQKASSLLNNATLVNPTLDVWVDQSTSYVHHMELIFDMNVNGVSFGTSTLSTTINVDMTVDYSKFNVPATISAPSGAIPTSNLPSVF